MTIKDWLNVEFVSSSIRTSEFSQFARDFRREIKKALPENSELCRYDKGHFEVFGFIFGFICRNRKYVYFSIADVRYWHNDWYINILIRIAGGEGDRIGRENNYTSLENFKENVEKLLS